MKLWKMLVAVSLVGSVSATEKVIYGDDDRLDLFESGDSMLLEVAQSTAGQIDWSNIADKGESYEISTKSLANRGICKDQKFAAQPTAANCSGFLVGKDLLVTAGHCIRSQFYCDRSAWVFDYGIKNASEDDKFKDTDGDGKITFNVSKKSVYRCKEIIEQTLDNSTQDDFALVRLDRVVEGRRPLTVRQKDKVGDKTEIVVIGHPTGLPTKIAAGAAVRTNNNNFYFVSNLDTFGGNSGSAVLDVKTGMVEGILVRGEADYTNDHARGCQVPKQCSNSDCRGEDVTRITNMKKLMQILAGN